ncbi:C4-dicarboxylate ABC transporter [Rhizobiales bacterium]|uniref:SLAC1 anion channel family protein n=1 Tax=Hongsoonwoonella zoysiae TaxID=2821844 RepID=UPI001561127A|nr:SLAC1 anion channel family protein [Hongsoonwoonella zoysiae]NRG18787.1 C4-dicarboxylate ABC transporter [Hongsoonwoonella zoysiae]
MVGSSADDATVIGDLQKLPHLPVNLFAIVMGMAGLTLATIRFESASGVSASISLMFLGATVSVLLLLSALYLLKLVKHPQAVRAEWNHPVKIAFFPAISIGLILTGTALAPFFFQVGRVVWAAGAILHLAATLAVISAWIGHRSFEPVHLNPAWFIPVVGNVLVPIGGVGFGFVEISWFFFSISVVFWTVLLTLVFNRLIFHNPLPERLLPTLVILVAPPSAGFIAWMQLSGELNAFGRILYFSGLFFVMVVTAQIGRFAKLPFTIAWWAYSFPLAAFSVATFIYADVSGYPAMKGVAYAVYAVLLAVLATLVIKTINAARRDEICQPD